MPREMRGVHVTMALASLRGKLDGVRRAPARRPEHDRARREGRERRGRVRPRRAARSRARPARRSRTTTRAAAARKVHAAGLYLIGRVVTFQDPVVSERRPGLALHNPDGSVWHTRGGLGWLNPYDRRVWDYDVAIATAAARAGFDEIQFDYVRFPSDGDVCVDPLPRAHERVDGEDDHAVRAVCLADSSTSSASASPSTSSGSPRRAISASGRSRTASRGTSTPSTRWSTRRISTPASTGSPIRTPIRARP